MKFDIVKTKNNTYYYASISVRNGNKITTKRVKTLGDYNSFVKEGFSDPLIHAQDLFKDYINNNDKEISLDLTIDFKEELDKNNNSYSESTYKNIGCTYLDDIYNALSINSFFNAKYHENKSKYKYDINLIIKLLVFSRISTPGSKLKNYKIKDNFIINTDKIDLHHIYRALDSIYENRDDLQYQVFNSSKKIINRNHQIMYFDCTNYYFETREEDEDIISDNNQIIYGLRKYGFSKQHQPKPLVQCGLYVDEDGIPVFLDVQPGNTSEKEMAIPSENKIIDNLKLDNLIYCADSGLNTCEIKANNVGFKKAYILTESLKILNENETNILLNDLNWEIHSFDVDVDNETKNLIRKRLKRISKDKFIEAINKQKQDLQLDEEEKLYVKIKKIRKSYTTNRLIKITHIYNEKTKQYDKKYEMKNYITEEGLNKAISDAKKYMSNFNKAKYNKKQQFITYQLLEEKLINTFDKYYYFYATEIFNNQIERAKKDIEENKYFSKSNNDPKRFIKPCSTSVEGEKVETKMILNEKKIEEEKKYLGYYLISTSLTDSDEKEVVRINSNRWRIEENFRITKTYFNSRPVYLSTSNRIKAHFYICYLALTILCILEKLMKEKDNKKYKVEDIILTLNNMKVQNVDDKFYISLYKSSETLTRLEEIFDFGLNKKKYNLVTINKFRNRKSSKLLKKKEK